MTQLDLTGYREGAVSDLVVQTIVAQMPKLTVFKFSHESCTDLAVTGIENQLKGRCEFVEFLHEPNICNLFLGLTHLGIYHCHGISTEALLMSARHAFLRSLEYRHCNDVIVRHFRTSLSYHKC